MGLNGAGETTLLKIIVGLIINFDGNVLINDLAATDRTARLRMSFLPEDFSQPLYLTGYDFVSYMCYEWDYKGLLSYMRVITRLDPYNKGPFFFAVYFMSYRTDSDGRLIFNYLEEAQDKFPDD